MLMQAAKTEFLSTVNSWVNCCLMSKETHLALFMCIAHLLCVKTNYITVLYSLLALESTIALLWLLYSLYL